MVGISVYILIKNGTVQNIIQADQTFIDSISKQYDKVVIVPQGNSYPSPGDTDNGDGTFTPAAQTKLAQVQVSLLSDTVPVLNDVLNYLLDKNNNLSNYIQ